MLSGLFMNGCRVCPHVVGFRFCVPWEAICGAWRGYSKEPPEAGAAMQLPVTAQAWDGSHQPQTVGTEPWKTEIWVLGVELYSKYKGRMECLWIRSHFPGEELGQKKLHQHQRAKAQHQTITVLLFLFLALVSLFSIAIFLVHGSFQTLKTTFSILCSFPPIPVKGHRSASWA